MNEYLTRLYRELPDVRRLSLCDKRGTQFTYNIEKRDGEMISCDNFNKNWSCRGYFSKALESLALGGKSCISNSYRDFSTKEPIMTYFYDIGDAWLLFFDFCAEIDGL